MIHNFMKCHSAVSNRVTDTISRFSFQFMSFVQRIHKNIQISAMQPVIRQCYGLNMKCQNLRHNIPVKRKAIAVCHNDCVVQFTILCQLGEVNSLG